MRIFTEKEAEDFLEKQGFPVVKRKFIKNEKEALSFVKKNKFPVVLKVSSKKILHKSDVRGVIVNIKQEDELKEAIKKLKKLSKELVIQKFVKGHYVLIGLKKDETFGHVLVFGSGGIYAEIMKDIAMRICPVDDKEIDRMIKEVKMYEILKGARGEKTSNINAVKNFLKKMSKLSQNHKKISELDINPLIVNEKEAVIIDARIVFE